MSDSRGDDQGPRVRAVGAALGVAFGIIAFWLMHRTLGDNTLVWVSERGPWQKSAPRYRNRSDGEHQDHPLNVSLLRGEAIALVGDLRSW